MNKKITYILNVSAISSILGYLIFYYTNIKEYMDINMFDIISICIMIPIIYKMFNYISKCLESKEKIYKKFQKDKKDFWDNPLDIEIKIDNYDKEELKIIEEKYEKYVNKLAEETTEKMKKQLEDNINWREDLKKEYEEYIDKTVKDLKNKYKNDIEYKNNYIQNIYSLEKIDKNVEKVKDSYEEYLNNKKELDKICKDAREYIFIAIIIFTIWIILEKIYYN